ncbi:MAG: ABC transporter permease subunit [Deltaproteobacteria bacterium]|nr:ABC transporter permease subunit [Deltaproteobacteria bacterium]MBI4373720.1 ABC transporter permease subunit [Deltaproteobacteria bacterium]
MPWIRQAVVTASFLLLPVSAFCEQNSLEKIKSRGFLLWGADREGGAPFIFPDPKEPEHLLGFEVEIARAIAKELGVGDRQFQDDWDNLIPALQKGDFDLSLDGIEITPEREREVLFSRPFYIYTEQIVVRKDEGQIRQFEDLKGKRVGTLSASAAMGMLVRLGGVNLRVYKGQVEPYLDLALGRIDAVFLDLPIAQYYAGSNPELKFVGEPVGEGFYGIAMRKGEIELKREIDRVIEKLLQNGTLQGIYEAWGIWNRSQQKLFQWASSDAMTWEKAREASTLRFVPVLLKGAGITIGLSCVAMLFAVLFGLFLTIVRVYLPGPLSRLATAYVEVYRGTPLLVQLYILYYGLPNIGISLGPIMAAILGLGMNYAAYESEIYRAGIAAIPRGQGEAAQALGMPQGLIVRRIILPQAIRITLPAVTNDFIALFKDSSIVSMIAMVELTKTYNILASTTFKYLELGLITALLYFGMSYPLSLLSRRLERRMGRTLK